MIQTFNKKQQMLSESQIKQNKKILLKQIRVHLKAIKKLKFKGVAYKRIEMLIIKSRAEVKAINRILNGNKLNYKKAKFNKDKITSIQKMNVVKPLVRAILKSDFPSRDDDNLLCVRVWEAQGSKPNMKLINFENKLIEGKFALPESITRSRRSLQEKYVSLRGNLFEERHQAEQKYKNQYKLDLD